MMASQMAMSSEVHLEAVLHVFAFLCQRYNYRMAFDPTYPVINMNDFKECMWEAFYEELNDSIPPNAPEERGKVVDLYGYVDSDHAGENKTKRSRSGVFIFFNTVLIQWFYKIQAMIETPVFRAEFVAVKIFMETLKGIRYNTRMMSVPISGPSYIYEYNVMVIHNTQRPESTLTKESNYICYHAVRYSVAMGKSLTGHVGTNKN